MNAKPEMVRDRLTLLDFSEQRRENSLSKMPVPAGSNPGRNRLLDALPPAEFNLLMADLKLIPMPRGKVIYESGVELKHVYFPAASCIVSMLHVMEDGACAEIAAVGNEGMVGVTSFMGAGATSSRATVQSAGNAFQLAVETLKKDFARLTGLQRLLLRYTQALIRQMSQNAVCNRHHSVEQQLQ
jgi:CRP-like cAMP-binding protein